MNRDELPQVDDRRCSTCGDCIAVCPTHCLELLGPLPWIARPFDCVSCTLCVMVCPTEALQMGALDER